MVWDRWVWAHGTVISEKELSSAGYYFWDLGSDFPSLTFSCLVCSLIHLGASLTGQMEPQAWQRGGA